MEAGEREGWRERGEGGEKENLMVEGNAGGGEKKILFFFCPARERGREREREREEGEREREGEREGGGGEKEFNGVR